MNLNSWISAALSQEVSIHLKGLVLEIIEIQNKLDIPKPTHSVSGSIYTFIRPKGFYWR